MDSGPVVSLVAGVCFFALLVAGIVLFWKGKALFLIAGNNYIPEEEKGSMAQRRLGRQVAVGLIFILVVPLSIIVFASAKLLGIESLVSYEDSIIGIGSWIVIAVAVVLMIVTCYDAYIRKR